MVRTALLYIVFIAGVVAIGGFIGYTNVPGAWFAQLNKPAFQPPDWLFAPVWTALYVLIGWVGARLWSQPDLYGLRPLWVLQMVLNFAWSPLFFGLEQPLWALGVIAVLWVILLIFITRSWKGDRPSALAFIPYVLWVTFATLLNAAIVVLN